MDAQTLAQRLEEARRGLLDLSTRNRLLALPKPGRSRGVVLLADEDAGFILDTLLAGKPLGFEAAPDTAAEAAAAPADPEAPASPNAKPRRRRATKPGKAEGVEAAAAGCTGGSSSTRSRISTSCMAPVVGWRSILRRSAQR